MKFSTNSALLLVHVPLNITCIQQAIYDFKINKVHIVYKLTGNRKRRLQIEDKIQNLKDAEVSYKLLSLEDDTPAITLEDRIRVYSEYLDELKKYKFDMIFISDFRIIWQKDIIENLDCNNIFLLDDGTATLMYYEDFWSKQKYFHKNTLTSTEKQQEANNYKKKYNLKNRNIDSIKIYTIFEELSELNKNIIFNSLEYLKKNNKDIDNSTSIIIGFGLSAHAHKIAYNYILYIQKLLFIIKSDIIIYYPHPSEDLYLLRIISQMDSRIIVIDSEMPIENWLTLKDTTPGFTYGMVSTSFFIIDKFFPKITQYVYLFDDELMNKIEISHKNYGFEYSFIKGIETILKYLPKKVLVSVI